MAIDNNILFNMPNDCLYQELISKFEYLTLTSFSDHRRPNKIKIKLIKAEHFDL